MKRSEKVRNDEGDERKGSEGRKEGMRRREERSEETWR